MNEQFAKILNAEEIKKRDIAYAKFNEKCEKVAFLIASVKERARLDKSDAAVADFLAHTIIQLIDDDNDNDNVKNALRTLCKPSASSNVKLN